MNELDNFFDTIEELREESVSSNNVHLQLISQLKDPDPETRQKAASYLGWLRPINDSVQALIEALIDESRIVRIEAAGSIMTLAPEAPQAVGPLVEAMRSGDDSLKNNAILALGALKADANEAIPDIIETLKNGDDTLRTSAALALGEIWPRATSAIPALMEALNDSNEYVLSYAVKALGAIDPTADGVIPALVQVLDNDIADASTVLSNIGTPAVPYLVEALENGNTESRINAALALRDMGTEARGAVSALSQALKDENEDVRTISRQALDIIVS